jgi:putative ABC transport system ATP-binding protein
MAKMNANLGEVKKPSGVPVIRAVDVIRTYQVGHEQVHALKGVNMEVGRGELVALMGRSGSGKTTLLNLIGGLDRPTSGQILLDGTDTSKLNDAALTEVRRHKIGFIFQSFALLPVLSAYENVELPMHIAGVSRRDRQQRATEVLQLVGLGKRMHHRPYELSGGEQQRVAIARSLANRPALVLADEPTGELDSITGLQIMALFRHVVEAEGVTIVAATHDPTFQEVVDYTYRISDGVMAAPEPGTRAIR